MTESISTKVPNSIQKYPLTEESIVFIVGAWGGDQAQYYADNYNPNLCLFEPQKEAAEVLANRFANNAKAVVHNFGLGSVSGKFKLSRVGTDRCSFVHRLEGKDGDSSTFEGPYEQGELVEVCKFMDDYKIKEVGFCLINCEGYEFQLLPWMVGSGIISKFKYLMVQFHLHHAGAEKMQEIRKLMSKTHDIRDDYEPAWIVWKLKIKSEIKSKAKTK